MSRKAAFGAAAALVLAALVYCAAWWVAADRLREGFESWAADMRARGWSVAYERLRIGGFPGPLAPTIEAPSIAAPAAAGGWRWRGPRVTAKAWPWNPSRIAFAGPGGHRFETGAAGTPPIHANLGAASGLLLRADSETRIDLALGDIAIRMPERTSPVGIGKADATIVLPDRPGRADEGRGPEPPGPTIALRLEGVEPGGEGQRIDAAALAAKLIGPVPRTAGAKALAVWRDGGGVIEIGEIALRSKRASIEGAGTLALDRGLQPIAALSLRIDGTGDLLRLLVALDIVSRRDAGAVGLGLHMLARAGKGEDGKGTFPVTIQNRRLYIGPLSVTRLPRIDWGG